MHISKKTESFPAPSSASAPLDTPGYGQNVDCVTVSGIVAGTGTWSGATQVHFGALPTRALGLPDSASVDGWGHRLLYAVTDSYTSLGTPQQYMFSGSIRLEDSNLNSSTTPPNKAIYTVIALGPDTRGAYTMNGACCLHALIQTVLWPVTTAILVMAPGLLPAPALSLFSYKVSREPMMRGIILS